MKQPAQLSVETQGYIKTSGARNNLSNSLFRVISHSFRLPSLLLKVFGTKSVSQRIIPYVDFLITPFAEVEGVQYNWAPNHENAMRFGHQLVLTFESLRPNINNFAKT